LFVQCLTREILIELLAAFGEGTEIRPPFYCDYGYPDLGRGTLFPELGRDVA